VVENRFAKLGRRPEGQKIYDNDQRIFKANYCSTVATYIDIGKGVMALYGIANGFPELKRSGTNQMVKNGVFWDVTPCGSCKNRRFVGT
jgi:hypothetical protein